MHEEQVIALTLLGLIVWNIAAYSVSLIGNGGGPVTATHASATTGGNIFQQVENALKPFTCFMSSLYGIIPSSCRAAQTNTTGTGQTPTAKTSVWFLPVLILTFASYLNALWVLVGFTSLQLHRRRFEVEDSMAIAAVQAILPLATPILMLLQVFEDKLPTAKPQDQEPAIEA